LIFDFSIDTDLLVLA